MMPQSRPPLQDDERQSLEAIRTRYEAEGFDVTLHPGAEQVPDFLGSYLPDALARKPGHNIVIEVKQHQHGASPGTLSDVRRLFDGRPDWQFQVVYLGDGARRPAAITVVDPAEVRGNIDDLRALLAQGYRRPAFVMAWSLLEAAYRARGTGAVDRLYGPGTVVQTLAMNGLIEPETEVGLRALIDLRNRIVHGDLTVEPTEADIEQVLSAIVEALDAQA